MISLKNKDWRPFKVKDIFDSFEKCKCSNAGLLEEGSIPYVGATKKNNGVMRFVDDTKKITKGNCVCFICDGQGSVGLSMYKEEDFVGSTTLLVGRKKGLNRYIAWFLTVALDKNRTLYSYGYKRKENRLKNECIMLPINNQGEPDYDFMDAYMREREKNLRKIQVAEIQRRLKRLGEKKSVVSLKEKTWGAFKIKDIFKEIKRGKRLKNGDHIPGDKPYVSSSAIDNGVADWVGNETRIREFSDCLSLANSGSVGSCFYEPFSFVASDHITHLKNDSFNEYIYLFCANMLSRLSEKYNFNREINDKRISKEIIPLPVNEAKEPDYIFMEQYIRNLEIDKYNAILKEINNIS